MTDSLTIILPAFNEAMNIKDVVSEVVSYIRVKNERFEIIIVNDGSTDDTVKIIKELEIMYPEVKAVSYGDNHGVGYAIYNGVQQAGNDWIFLMDSDKQFRINDFDLFWEKRKNYDFILGYRCPRRDNLYRRMLGQFGNLMANILLLKRVRDINCSMKLFKTKDLKKITLFSTGGIFNFEILYKLFKKPRKYCQVPVTHYCRIKGKQTGGDFITILTIIKEAAFILMGR